MRFQSAVTAPSPPPPTKLGSEIHLPLRAHYGRIESTRLAPWLYSVERLGAAGFRRRLVALCRDRGVTAIHAISHGMDFWYAYQVARELDVPYYLSVHDDLGYALKGRPEFKTGMARIGEAWRNARACFPISRPMGEEYCRRYGARSYAVVTDGLDSVRNAPSLRRTPDGFNLYFMGLFHLSYQDNLNALLKALALFRDRRPGLQVSMTCRCGSLPPDLLRTGFPIKVLPFGSEQDVERDLAEADALYLPLPFGSSYEAFTRFSLSTKLITYLGSGIPIFYHGPSDAAAGQLLAAHQAAVPAPSLMAEEIAESLMRLESDAEQAARNALDLAERQFLSSVQRKNFWSQFGHDTPDADRTPGVG